MSLRSVIEAIKYAYGQVVTPGNSAVAASVGATGTVTLSGSALGSFAGLLQIVSSGALGAATAQLSLDGGQTFGSVFTIPLLINQPYQIPLDASPVLSGITLGFSGTFTAGDSYTFTSNGTCSFWLGEEYIPYQGDIFPRIVFVPTRSSFVGPQDYSGAQNQDNSVKSLLTDKPTLEAHCWGIDYDRAELLRDQLVNAFVAGFGSGGFTVLECEWIRNKYEINKAGRVVMAPFTFAKPIAEFKQSWAILQGPFTEVSSQQIDPYQGG